MRNFEQKRMWKNIMQSKLVLMLFGILILFFAFSVFRFWSKMQETKENREAIENKVTQLKEQKEKLSFDIENLNTDKGKEKLFRENFGLVKEGENMIIVVEDKNPPEVLKDESSSGFLNFFKNWFK